MRNGRSTASAPPRRLPNTPAASSATRWRDCAAEYPDPAALEQAFLTFGEYAIAPGFELKPWLAHCIAQPAARRADTDYQALDPNP